jgi:hypothetical protein
MFCSIVLRAPEKSRRARMIAEWAGMVTFAGHFDGLKLSAAKPLTSILLVPLFGRVARTPHDLTGLEHFHDVKVRNRDPEHRFFADHQ